MEIEVKKDSKKIEISKDTIILILIVALVAVSAGAVFLGCFREEGDRNENGREGMMRQYRQSGRYIDDNNVNPNDAEVKDDQDATVNTNNVAPSKNTVTKTVSNTPVVPPVTTPKVQ